MKGILFAFLLVMLSSGVSFAQDARDADHDQLRGLMKAVVQAVSKKDVALLASCFADTFSFTAVNQTRVTSHDGFKKMFDEWFFNADAPFESVTLDAQADILTQFIGNDAGYCYGTDKETYRFKNGDVAYLNTKWTATVAKQDGKWKIVAVHAGTDFLQRPEVVYASWWKRVLAKFGLIGI